MISLILACWRAVSLMSLKLFLVCADLIRLASPCVRAFTYKNRSFHARKVKVALLSEYSVSICFIPLLSRNLVRCFSLCREHSWASADSCCCFSSVANTLSDTLWVRRVALFSLCSRLISEELLVFSAAFVWRDQDLHASLETLLFQNLIMRLAQFLFLLNRTRFPLNLAKKCWVERLTQFCITFLSLF